MSDIVAKCNNNQSCAGVRNLDCNGALFQTCFSLPEGSNDQKCTYEKANRHSTDISEQRNATSRTLTHHTMSTATSVISTDAMNPSEIKDHKLCVPISIFVTVSIVLVLLLLITIVTVYTVYIKRQGSTPKEIHGTNRELSYDDDGYDLADTYATTNTGVSENNSNVWANNPSNENNVDPEFAVENPYYGESYDFGKKNGQVISDGAKQTTTKHVLVHQNPYYDQS